MKRIIIISLGLLLLASGTMATDTRVMTMGDNNNVLLDEANIWLYPSRINYYPDLAEMELVQHEYYDDWGSSDGPEETNAIERVGVNLKFGGDKPYVIGLYLHNNDQYYNQFSPIGGPYHGSFDYGSPSGYSNKRADFFYGRKLGEMNAGMHFGFVHSSEEYLEDDDFDARAFSQYTFEFGVTKDDKLDIMVGLEMFSFTDLNTEQLNYDLSSDTIPVYGGVDDYEADGNSRIYFNARYFHEVNPTVTFVPHVGLSLGTYKYNEWDWNYNPSPDSGYSNQLDYSREVTETEFTLGSGLHYTPSSKVLTVLDFGLKNRKVVYKTDEDGDIEETSYHWTALPYIKLGFEADVFKWLDVRFGAETYWTKYTYEDVADERKYAERYPDNRNYLGFGFHWGRFHVDTYANPQLFLDGFDFIAGSNDNDEYYNQQMNFKISAVYEMH